MYTQGISLLYHLGYISSLYHLGYTSSLYHLGIPLYHPGYTSLYHPGYTSLYHLGYPPGYTPSAHSTLLPYYPGTTRRTVLPSLPGLRENNEAQRGALSPCLRGNNEAQRGAPSPCLKEEWGAERCPALPVVRLVMLRREVPSFLIVWENWRVWGADWGLSPCLFFTFCSLLVIIPALFPLSLPKNTVGRRYSRS